MRPESLIRHQLQRRRPERHEGGQEPVPPHCWHRKRCGKLVRAPGHERRRDAEHGRRPHPIRRRTSDIVSHVRRPQPARPQTYVVVQRVLFSPRRTFGTDPRQNQRRDPERRHGPPIVQRVPFSHRRTSGTDPRPYQRRDPERRRESGPCQEPVRGRSQRQWVERSAHLKPTPHSKFVSRVWDKQ